MQNTPDAFAIDFLNRPDDLFNRLVLPQPVSLSILSIIARCSLGVAHDLPCYPKRLDAVRPAAAIHDQHSKVITAAKIHLLIGVRLEMAQI